MTTINNFQNYINIPQIIQPQLSNNLNHFPQFNNSNNSNNNNNNNNATTNNLPPLIHPQFMNQNIPLVQQQTNYNILPPPPGLLIQPQQFKIDNNNNSNNNKEIVNGGVSENLDYDIDLMSEFVTKTAYFIFGSDTRLMLDSNIDNNNNSLAITSPNNYNLFLKGIISVLNATRLPSVTIFMSLDYLLKYLRKLPDGIDSIGGKFINVIYQNTIVSLILANKFNDDKTFTNKSWSQATGMDIDLINSYEKNWLNIFNWKLYDDKFILYSDFVNSFRQFSQEKTLLKQSLDNNNNYSTNYYTSSINELNIFGNLKSPLNVPSPYFSPTGVTTPSTPFGFQTPKLSSISSSTIAAATAAAIVAATKNTATNTSSGVSTTSSCGNQIFSSPYHYLNDAYNNNNNNTNNTMNSQFSNYDYHQNNLNHFNIPTLKSSPIMNRYTSNNHPNTYDDQFNYDYYNFYDSKQDMKINQQQQLQQLQLQQQQQILLSQQQQLQRLQPQSQNLKSIQPDTYWTSNDQTLRNKSNNFYNNFSTIY
ncbi:similar to Saccharomyces cerevisiae YGL215W CLG1 Cyclin-like protein that interacts with Pho85p [Maudiozyma saulgeensis]|uniref:Similar to Saccharomyces cerevisiae YGL215W CLG1 Cyclin-like protein that interacts with Pho85p n=1 Tax=Maudiozyma saulgeensis TaxID=1789683 RepID=A0A1X7QXA1_9SACH|nr:similar to Saccharomyces cerevisiae YGL215W CLG1 Cyclin-like protein that interacts with Pho85p [Kazachstania saulgeensis]